MLRAVAVILSVLGAVAIMLAFRANEPWLVVAAAGVISLGGYFMGKVKK